MLTSVVKAWNDQHAWAVTQRLEEHIRENQPKGWQPTTQEDGKIDALVRRRSLAGRTFDMDAWERAHYDLLNLCLGSWKRFRKKAPKPKSKNEPSKKTGKVST